MKHQKEWCRQPVSPLVNSRVVFSLTEEIEEFATTFIKSLESCLDNTPELLKSQKLRGNQLKESKSLTNCAQFPKYSFVYFTYLYYFLVAKSFVRLLKRNMTFINLAQVRKTSVKVVPTGNSPIVFSCHSHTKAELWYVSLFQTARPVFLSYESMSGILNEFHSLDLRKILTELLFLTEQKQAKLPVLLMCKCWRLDCDDTEASNLENLPLSAINYVVFLVMKEFENLLVKQAPIEAYAEWFDSIVEEYVLKDNVSAFPNFLEGN